MSLPIDPREKAAIDYVKSLRQSAARARTKMKEAEANKDFESERDYWCQAEYADDTAKLVQGVLDVLHETREYHEPPDDGT